MGDPAFEGAMARLFKEYDSCEEDLMSDTYTCQRCKSNYKNYARCPCWRAAEAAKEKQEEPKLMTDTRKKIDWSKPIQRISGQKALFTVQDGARITLNGEKVHEQETVLLWPRDKWCCDSPELVLVRSDWTTTDLLVKCYFNCVRCNRHGLRIDGQRGLRPTRLVSKEPT